MSSKLCENCHAKPKSGSYKFCGKTCAAQAAANPARSKQPPPQGKAGPRNVAHQKGAPAPQKTVQLCINCGQKPKFNGFDYCGKSCAGLASATQTNLKQPATQGPPTTKQKAMHSSNAPPNNSPTPSSTKPHRAHQAKAPVPQGDSEEDEEPEEEEDDGGVSTDLDAYPSDSEAESEDEPSAPAVAAPQPGAKGTPKGGKPSGAVPRTALGTCIIPGCSQPSHVDRHGVKTMYCSIKHREEAVKLGLKPACIMCQRYPQSTSDYFCSSACRNQSMTKT